jgi:hypothetical protein
MPLAAANVGLWTKSGVVYKEVEMTTIYGGGSVVIIPEELGKNMEELPIVTFSRGDFFSKRRMIKAKAGYGEEIISAEIDLSFYTRLRKEFLKHRKFWANKSEEVNK